MRAVTGGHTGAGLGADVLYYHDGKDRLKLRLLGSERYQLRLQEGDESLNAQWSRLESRPDDIEMGRNAEQKIPLIRG